MTWSSVVRAASYIVLYSPSSARGDRGLQTAHGVLLPDDDFLLAVSVPRASCVTLRSLNPHMPYAITVVAVDEMGRMGPASSTAEFQQTMSCAVANVLVKAEACSPM